MAGLVGHDAVTSRGAALVELGGRLHGRPLPFGADDPYSPDLLIARPAVHEAILDVLLG